eukprot:10142-Heterococcus_DN1.PRE.3
MSTGAIVAIVQQHACPAPVQYMAWGGMVRDVKRRDTRCYQLATAGDKKVMLWSLDPYAGELTGEKLAFEGRGAMQSTYENEISRPYCAAAFCVKTKHIGRAVPVCRLGARSLLSWHEGVLVGGGDGTVTSFDGQFRDVAQAQLRGAVVAMSFRYDPTAKCHMMLNDRHASSAVTLPSTWLRIYSLCAQCSPASPKHFNIAVVASVIEHTLYCSILACALH